MAQAFGQGFLGDRDLRARLALPLDTSQMQTPRISTISPEHPAYLDSRVTSGYPSSQSGLVPSNYTLPPNVQPFPLPEQNQRPLQQATGDLSTQSPPMCFSDYLKLHNQLAIPLPLPLGDDSLYTSSHGVMPNASVPGYPTSTQQRYSHAGTWSDATSGHRSNPTASMALDDNAGGNWPYHLASFPSEVHGERGPHGDQTAAHGSGLRIHRNYSSPQQQEEPSPTTSNHKYQTWEELARELGFQNK